MKRRIRARDWLETYLLGSRGNRELEQFVLIEGKAKGFSEKLLRKAAADCRFVLKDGWWAVSELRLEALEIRAQIANGAWRPAPYVAPGPGVVRDVDTALQMLAVRVSRNND